MYESHDDFSQNSYHHNRKFSVNCKSFGWNIFSFCSIEEMSNQIQHQNNGFAFAFQPKFIDWQWFRGKAFCTPCSSSYFSFFISLCNILFHTFWHIVCVFCMNCTKTRNIFSPFQRKKHRRKVPLVLSKVSASSKRFMFYLFIIFSARLWIKWKHKHERSVCLLLDFLFDIQYYLGAVLQFSGQCCSLFDMKISRARKLDPA